MSVHRARTGPPPVRRLAMISLHTSPLDQPGTGDAGGMNVYVNELAKRLADRGVEVDIFTRATSARRIDDVDPFPGVHVRHVLAGPLEGLAKNELPAQLCSFARGVLRYEAAAPPGRYDMIHSHYWLSGQVGALAAERWNVPLVHTMHTMAKVKNLALADGESAEPAARVLGEEQVVEASTRLVANTAVEARQLIDLYDADPDRVSVVHPGVDLDMFHPVDNEQRRRLRRTRHVPENAVVVLFAGRFQPHKAPDLVVRALGRAVAAGTIPADGPVLAIFVGGPSGTSSLSGDDLHVLAGTRGVSTLIRTEDPATPVELARWYQLADLVVVPSYSESFGLVAVEAQACGTPVLAAAVGGLPVAVANGRSGLLVDGHDEETWAHALARLTSDRAALAGMRAGAVEHARGFAWENTAEDLLGAYAAALDDRSYAQVG
jgi:D-inositol-3-phosphate glycosyltransferase